MNILRLKYQILMIYQNMWIQVNKFNVVYWLEEF